MNRTIILTSIAWCGSLVAAWWLGGRNTASSAASEGAANVAAAVAAGEPGKLTGRPDAVPSGAKAGSEVPVKNIISWYAQTNVPPAERMEKIMQLDDQYERMTAYLELLGSLKSDDEMMGAFQTLMKNFDGRSRGRELSMLMGKWAASNPEAALAESVKIKDWSGQYAAGTVLATWVKANPEAAKAWALANHKPREGDEDGNYYMVGVISGLAKSNPELAAQWAQEQPRSRARGEMMDRIVDNMAKSQGVEAAQAWVNNLPEGTFRTGVTRKVAWKLTEKDPVASAAWIEAIPSIDARRDAMRDLVDHWAGVDANAAGKWLQKFPQAPEMDEPRRTFAWEIREKDPESAVAWAGTVQDQKQRDRLMVELLRDWSRRDKSAAQGYMQRNNWPPETQSKVFN